MTAVDAWARPLIARVGDAPIPLFGSAEWALAPDSVRVASCVRAALAWRVECDPHRLAVLIEAELEAARRAEAEDWKPLRSYVRGLASAATHAELVARRAEPARPVACTTPWREAGAS